MWYYRIRGGDLMDGFKHMALRLISLAALAVAVLNVNSSCPLYMYEPDEPQEAKKYKL